MIARVTAGDAAWVDATVSRVADILAEQHPDLGRDERRSIAFGYLARPAELLALLLDHTEDAPDEEAASQDAGHWPTGSGAPPTSIRSR